MPMVEVALFGGAILFGVWLVAPKAWSSARRFSPDMNLLMVVAVAGAIGGPLAFFAGASIGAVELVSPAIALIAIGIGWAVMLPLLVKVAVWLEDGHRLVEQSA